jgi:hypothetical protein
MAEPKVTRPHFPPGYVDHPSGHVAWAWVEERLDQAVHYWLCTVRPDGRPHAVPKWAVWVDGSIYFDGSPETLHARNLARNPAHSPAQVPARGLARGLAHGGAHGRAHGGAHGRGRESLSFRAVCHRRTAAAPPRRRTRRRVPRARAGRR